MLSAQLRSQTLGMKRRDLLRALDASARQAGLELAFVRHGGSHDIYRIEAFSVSIPRHNDVNELTARVIMRQVRDYLEGRGR